MKNLRKKILFNMPVLLLGLAMFLVGLIPVIMASIMYFWPVVSGEIIHTDIDKIELDDDGNTYYQYCPKIVYSYTVSGKIRESNNYSTDTLLGNRNFFYCDSDIEVTMELLKAYPEGGRIAVHYNPGKPDSSYILFEWKFLLGLIIVAVGVLFFGLGIRSVLDDRYDD